jgi:hypothetical protein
VTSLSARLAASLKLRLQKTAVRCRFQRRERNRKAELSCGREGETFISRGPQLDGRVPGADLAPVAFGGIQTFARPALVANKNRRVGLSRRAHLFYSIGFGPLASDKREAWGSDSPPLKLRRTGG